MLKFLEQVKLVIIFIVINFIIANATKFAKILKSALVPNFDRNRHFKENAMSKFHAIFKNRFLDLIYIYLDTKIISKCQKISNFKDFVHLELEWAAILDSTHFSSGHPGFRIFFRIFSQNGISTHISIKLRCSSMF